MGASIIGRERRACGSTRGNGKAQLLIFVLKLIQTVVNASFGQQLLMRALFAQTALVEDKDSVGILDGAQAMRDDNGCTSGEQPVQSFADHYLRARVHAGSGFVED